MRDDEVRLEAAGDIEDLRAHLEAGCRNREGPHLEAFRLGDVLEDRQRLLARRIVVVDVGDLLSLEVAAKPLFREGHGGARLRPVAGRDREGVGIALAVGRGGGAEARRRAEDLVLFQLLVEGRGLRRAVQALDHGAFLLEALVRFDRRRHLVLVVDLEDLDLVALDAALAVDQGDVVLVARAQHGADVRRRPGAIALQAEDDLLLGEGLARAQRQGGGRCRQSQPTTNEPRHGFLPCLSTMPRPSTRRARPGSSSGYSSTVD